MSNILVDIAAATLVGVVGAIVVLSSPPHPRPKPTVEQPAKQVRTVVVRTQPPATQEEQVEEIGQKLEKAEDSLEELIQLVQQQNAEKKAETLDREERQGRP